MIFKSEDKIIEFTITDDETGDAVDLTTAAGIIVALYQNASRTPVKFSKVAAAGYSTIDVTDAATGKIRVSYEEADSKQTNDNKLFYEIKIRFVNGSFLSNKQDVIAKGEIDLMQESVFKNTDVPTP